MSNTLPRASKWVTFLASRSEFPAGEKLLAAFHAGKITRLCDCGCNSFNIEVDEGAAMPLAQPGDRGGAIFELEFRTSEDQHTLEFVVLVGANGQLSGSACNLTRRPSRDSLRLPLASNAREGLNKSTDHAVVR